MWKELASTTRCSGSQRYIVVAKLSPLGVWGLNPVCRHPPSRATETERGACRTSDVENQWGCYAVCLGDTRHHLFWDEHSCCWSTVLGNGMHGLWLLESPFCSQQWLLGPSFSGEALVRDPDSDYLYGFGKSSILPLLEHTANTTSFYMLNDLVGTILLSSAV